MRQQLSRERGTGLIATPGHHYNAACTDRHPDFNVVHNLR